MRFTFRFSQFPQFALSLALMLAAGHSTAANVRAQIVDAAGAPFPEAVVALYSPAPTNFPQPAQAVMDQRGKRYDPHVLAVRKNTFVKFPNSDDIRHQVYSFSPTKRFELKLYHAQTANPVLFDTAGEVVLGCNIHDQMVGYIYVVDTAWFATSNPQGQAAIANVPPGTYSARLWYPGVIAGSAGLEQAVVVGANGETTLTFKVAVQAAPVAAPVSDLQQLFKRRGG